MAATTFSNIGANCAAALADCVRRFAETLGPVRFTPIFFQKRTYRRSGMRMIAEYLENALKFERLAAEESDPKMKTEFEKQAVAYRKLAAERVRKPRSW